MRVAHKNFTGGEIAPNLSARYDLQRFALSAKEMTNFIPNLHGDAYRRPGTYFLEDLGSDCWLIPFRFNAEVSQNFVLVFSNYALRVANRNGWVMETAVTSPYAIEDCRDISYAQNGDIVYLAHQDYPLQKVVRTGDPGSYTWSIEQVVLNESLPTPGAPSCIWQRGIKVRYVGEEKRTEVDTDNETAYLRYKITAVDDDGRESLPSAEGGCTARYPTDWVQGDRVDLSWTGVSGATEYNIYRESAGTYGLIGVVSSSNASGGTVDHLQVGNETGVKVHFSGSHTRTVQRGLPSSGVWLKEVNGQYIPWEQETTPPIGFGYVWYTNSDSTTPISVVANAAQNAFTFDGHMIVWVTKTTIDTVWTLTTSSSVAISDPSDDDSGYYTKATYTTYDSYWALFPSTTVGTYEAVTGNVGTDSETPSGDIGPYHLVPVRTGATTHTFQDQNFEPDMTSTPKEDWDPFADGNNPGTIAFHQQRMVLGGTNSAPNTFYLSRVGDFENFRKTRPQMDDDPMEFQIASGSIDGIMWIASFGALLIGTASAEYKVMGNGEQSAITPKEIYITAQSYWGSSRMAPLIIGNSIMHCQRHGSRVRDLHYSLEKDGYTGNDLSVMAPHLIDGHTLRQWGFQQTPTSSLWCVRDDGALLCLTYMKEQEIWGWSKHETQGAVRSLATLSGGSMDEVVMVVKRRIGDTDHYFLERMEQPFGSETDITDAFFVDCGLKGEFETATDTVSGLSHLEGCTVDALCDGSPEVGLVVENGAVTLQYPAKKVIIGLPYTSTLAPMPVEADMQSGSTLGLRRGYGQTSIRMFRTVGGKFGCDKEHLYDFPFTPENWGEPCVPFSGDIECTPGGGQDSDTTIYVIQDRPLPMQIVAITETVDFAQQG